MEKIKVRFPRGAKFEVTDERGEITKWIFDRGTTHEFLPEIAARLIKEGLAVPAGVQVGPSVENG
jgi:hypothetical protein